MKKQLQFKDLKEGERFIYRVYPFDYKHATKGIYNLAFCDDTKQWEVFVLTCRVYRETAKS